MKKILATVLAIGATSLMVGCTATNAMSQKAQATPEVKTPTPSVLINVTSDDAQVQLMSMVLTMQSAQQGADTRVLLCGPAGDMALRDAPASATTGQPPKNMSPQGLMQTIMKNTKTKVEVCAIYLPSKGADQSILIDGVTAADPAEIGALMVDGKTQVVSF
ncbi:hypothetical protein [Psychrobacter fulvigenes]|uniref:hypothetical protein n=1 Tax=Psychrobacter fulvigenes TaxID=533323 RepID=UPI001919CAE7|nr:hypothetical protein [Psychrobacter fulvigenes]